MEKTAHFILSLILLLLLGLMACTQAMETPTAEWTTYRNAEGHFSLDAPPGWRVAEGYTMIYRYRSGLAAVNSLGRDGFWITQQQTGPSSWGYNPEVVLKQLPPGAVYLEVGLIEGPLCAPQDYGPEMEAQDLTPVRGKAEWEELVPGKLSRLELRFDKWGRTWSLLAYLAGPVAEADRRALDRVLDSLHFDAIPVGDERWAILQARQHLLAVVHPERFPLVADSTVGQEGVLYKTEAQRERDDVIVTFTYDWAPPATGTQDVCQTGCCHRWVFRVTATGQVILVGEEGEPLAVTPTPLARPTFREAVVALLSRPEAQLWNGSQVQAAMEKLAATYGFRLFYYRRAEGEPWVVFVSSLPGKENKPPRPLILWRDGDRVRSQTPPQWELFINPVQEARVVIRDGRWELGVIPASFGSTGDATFLLLRLTPEGWQIARGSGWEEALQGWAGSGGRVEFLG